MDYGRLAYIYWQRNNRYTLEIAEIKQIKWIFHNLAFLGKIMTKKKEYSRDDFFVFNFIGYKSQTFFLKKTKQNMSLDI